MAHLIDQLRSFLCVLKYIIVLKIMIISKDTVSSMLGRNKKASHAIYMAIDNEFHLDGKRTPSCSLGAAYGPASTVPRDRRDQLLDHHARQV